MMKVAGLFILTIFDMTSAGHIGHDGDHHHGHDQVGPTTSGTELFPLQSPGPFTVRGFIHGAMKLDGQAFIIQRGGLIVQGSSLAIGEYGVRKIISGFLTTETGHHVCIDGGILYGHYLHSRNTQAIRSALFRTGTTLEHFIQQTVTTTPLRVFEVTSGEISVSGTYRNINAAIIFILMVDVIEPITEGHEHVGPTTSDTELFPNQIPGPFTAMGFIRGAMKLDGQAFIIQHGGLIVQGSSLAMGEYGVRKIISGFLTTETGHHVCIDGGLLYGHYLHPRNTEAIRSVLFQAGTTLEYFVQQTGTTTPKFVFEVTSGVISISGTYMNINAAIILILMVDATETTTEGQGPVTGLVRTFTFAAAKLDGHAYTFRNGDLLLQGPPIEIGETGVFSAVSGFLTTETGHRVTVDDGILYVRALHPRNTEAIISALSRADMTLEHYIQQTGTNSPPQKVIEVTAGVVSINGIYININAAVLFILISDVTEPGTEGQTVVVTDTVAPETLTVSQPVTLTKTSTHDEYITITSPVYNSAVATYTNFVRRTVTVPEEQVIRSSVAGRVVVNTSPVSTQLVLTVTDTATNYFVSTALKTVTSTLQHVTSKFSFRTITVNNIITSTVVHTITRTSIATAYVTNTVGSTVYSTTVITVTISHGPATTETTIPVYY